jgi:hypothetical protein
MGLIGGIARTAVAAGTWTAVSNRVSRRQADRWAAQDQQQYYQQAPAYQQPVYQQPAYQQPAAYQQSAYQQPVAAAPAPTAPDPVERLKGLASLKEQGILTEAEFAAEKAKILGN